MRKRRLDDQTSFETPMKWTNWNLFEPIPMLNYEDSFPSRLDLACVPVSCLPVVAFPFLDVDDTFIIHTLCVCETHRFGDFILGLMRVKLSSLLDLCLMFKCESSSLTVEFSYNKSKYRPFFVHKKDFTLLNKTKKYLSKEFSSSKL